MGRSLGGFLQIIISIYTDRFHLLLLNSYPFLMLLLLLCSLAGAFESYWLEGAFCTLVVFLILKGIVFLLYQSVICCYILVDDFFRMRKLPSLPRALVFFLMNRHCIFFFFTKSNVCSASHEMIVFVHWCISKPLEQG